MHTRVLFSLLLSNLITDCEGNGSFDYSPKREYWNLDDALQNVNSCESLILFSMRLDTLDARVGELENLIYLDLSANELSELPSSIARVSLLQELDLGNNHFQRIPSAIYSLRNLDILNFRKNLLSILPDSLSLLINLHTLNALGNRIDSVSPGFCDAYGVESIVLDSNRLRWLPSEITHFRFLKELHLRGNPFSEEEKTRIRDLLPASVKIYF